MIPHQRIILSIRQESAIGDAGGVSYTVCDAVRRVTDTVDSSTTGRCEAHQWRWARRRSLQLLDWTEELSVEDDELDTEHKKLVDLLNELYHAMRSGKGNAVLGEVLKRVGDYTEEHFRHEEHICAMCKCPDLAAHREAHKKLLDEVSELQRRFELGEMLLSVQTLDFLQHWVADHIVQQDKQYVPHVRSWRRDDTA